MKKLILGSAIVAVLGVASNAMAAPNTGTVNFTGSVSTATCEINVTDSNGASVSAVNLGTLTNTAASGDQVKFKLVPQAPDCLGKTQANISWSSSTLMATGLSNAQADGTNATMALVATNATKTGAAGAIKTGSTSFDYSINEGIPSFDYTAWLVKPANETLTAGPFSASASYVIAYK
ncbi:MULTISPECIES: fimbrial protein [unclassified Enterobacter cloacae complex]|uniref:fimbrial protein n=1 Tax=unclassified Enterobacter cloacae complex TaxID=2757714 RepID=UPI00187299F9|nr:MULTISPECIES: fimbrial protein [unclassified Enterobacter cloacae complex]MBE4812117.1 fimbrial protein [Enterobacter cloacae complex sp. P44RS]MBE4829364.1 fimbrial protein [Enterobacter cloacae complex sp. P42RS]MBE4838426.1 fimbrial protein [Enterobacter cloacae complex sp. P46RS]MBE4842640.1 fimbrial protein [Enterobacter cloacae complex sp. P42C]